MPLTTPTMSVAGAAANKPRWLAAPVRCRCGCRGALVRLVCGLGFRDPSGSPPVSTARHQQTDDTLGRRHLPRHPQQQPPPSLISRPNLSAGPTSRSGPYRDPPPPKPGPNRLLLHLGRVVNPAPPLPPARCPTPAHRQEGGQPESPAASTGLPALDHPGRPKAGCALGHAATLLTGWSTKPVPNSRN